MIAVRSAARPRGPATTAFARLMTPAALMTGAVIASLLVQFWFLRSSWFFLDDIRNLAEARREGLTWSFLTEPIGEHFTPGHRFLDWLAAVPLGREWGGAVALLLACSAVLLAYVAGTLALLFGARRRNAIAVLLVGTAWPLLGSGQWFAGGALAIPAGAAIAGAAYHHTRWRVHEARRDWAAAMACTLAGLLFSLQAVLVAPFALACVLIARGGRPPLRSVVREGVALLPLLVPIVALVLYVRAQPWAPPSNLPAIGTLADIVRVEVVRGIVPAFVGLGMDGALPDPDRENLMRTLSAAGLGAGVLVALGMRQRWMAAALLAGCGVVSSALLTGAARTSLDPTIAGSEPRYLLFAVVLCALAIGALLAPQPDAGRSPPRAVVVVAAVIGVGWAGVYAANLDYTHDTRRFALDVSAQARFQTAQLERSLRTVIDARRADDLVAGPLPFALFYAEPAARHLPDYSRFFTSRTIAAPGVPNRRGLLAVSGSGDLMAVKVHRAGPPRRCATTQPCELRVSGPLPPGERLVMTVELARPAAAGSSLRYAVAVADGWSEHDVAVPTGARSLVLPLALARPGAASVRFSALTIQIAAARAGTLRPQ